MIFVDSRVELLEILYQITLFVIKTVSILTGWSKVQYIAQSKNITFYSQSSQYN